MNILRLNKICGDKQVLIVKLREWNLIPLEGEYMCPKCGGPFTLSELNSTIDGWKWRCFQYIVERKQKRKRCGYSREFRSGTFFAKSKFTIFQVLAFTNLWVSNASLKLITEQLEISTKSSVDWASFCREVVYETFFANPEKIGGHGKIVEIDESKFGKRKYHRGHRVEGQWVFGGFERETGKVFMVAVEYRNTDTLLPIIEQWVEKGTTIYSDCWKAYNCLSEKGYQHLSVNHSITFKDPETGVHTNSIESSWRHAKAINPSYGRKKEHIPGNLARYMFYKRCDSLKLNRTEEFLRMAGKLYDPRKINEIEHSVIHVADDEEREEIEENF